jgi:hypothetical protein
MGQDKVDKLKTEIQKLAWTTDPDERKKLATLKLKLYRLNCGDIANWSHIRGEFEDCGGYEDDLAPYHSLADTLSNEDTF